MFDHTLGLEHRRSPLDISTFGGPAPSTSEVSVSAHSDDLVECAKELLSRLPSDVYQALKEAMRG